MGRQLSASWRRASNVSRVAAPLSTRLKPRHRAADRPVEEGSIGRWEIEPCHYVIFGVIMLFGQVSPKEQEGVTRVRLGKRRGWVRSGGLRAFEFGGTAPPPPLPP